MTEKVRLDKFLTDEGFLASRSEAQAAILAGKVRVNGRVASKASEKVSAADEIEAEKAHPYVSRAALKLKRALELFPINPTGLHCLDVGSSTGGFTEILLEAGAAQVVAVDVGRDQFHDLLRNDERVSLFEQTDARHLTADMLSVPPQLIVCDASFIGLEKVLATAMTLAATEAQLVALFKPQFQVGPKHVGKGGIVTDEDAIETAKQAYIDWLSQNGWSPKGWAPSPITGSDGNQEWLSWAVRSQA